MDDNTAMVLLLGAPMACAVLFAGLKAFWQHRETMARIHATSQKAAQDAPPAAQK